MKTLNLAKMKNLHMCLNFKQILCVTLLGLTLSAHAEDARKVSVSRKPAAVEEETLTVPLYFSDSMFTNEKIFSEDDSGVMREIKSSFASWESTDEYAKKWDLKSTGLYNTPSADQRKAYLSQKMLRYADKRLAGEMKNSEEGSTLHKMKTVEKSLRPNAAVNVTKNFGFKFKARVIQGKGIVEVKNPWVECNATINFQGKVRVVTKKDFKKLGLASGAEYSVNDSQLLTYVDKQLTDNIKARVSNSRGPSEDSRAEISASFPFNL